MDTSQAQLDRARSHAEASSSDRQQPPTQYVLWPPSSEILPLEPGSADCEPQASATATATAVATCMHCLCPAAVLLWCGEVAHAG